MRQSNTNQLTPEQIHAMDNPYIIYAKHDNDGNKYRVRSVCARSDEAKARLGNIGRENHHPEWGDVKDVKMVQMHIDDVQPVLTLSQLKVYQGKSKNTNITPSRKKAGERSPWRTYKKKSVS